MFHRRMYNACNYHNMHTINLLWMQIIAIYISIIPSTFKRKYTFIDDQMENSLHNMIPNSCHSSQEILRPCWWKSSPNLRVFANEIGNEWNLARPSDLWVISEYNFGSFSLFCLISTVSVQHHQCDPITLVKAISWIHYSSRLNMSAIRYHDLMRSMGCTYYLFKKSSFIQLWIVYSN